MLHLSKPSMKPAGSAEPCALRAGSSTTLLQRLFQFSLILLIVALAGCSRRYSDVPAYWPIPMKEYDNQSVGRFKSSFFVTQIDKNYRGVNPGPIGVTTFVNLDDLYTSSSFGRIYAEQVMSELAMMGYDVVELRHSDALQFLMNNGEFALSRDVGSIRRQRDLGAVLVGTYVVSPERVYVNGRLVDPSNSRVLSAGSVEMSKSDEIHRLVRAGTVSPSLERIPVRHLDIGSYSAFSFPSMRSRWQMEEMGGPMMGGGMMKHPAQGLQPVIPEVGKSSAGSKKK